MERALATPEAGVVLSHAASPGDRLSEGDEILRLAAAGSAVFQAEVSQNDLAWARPGQAARIHLAAMPDTLAGVVQAVSFRRRAVLPSDAPVRIDFRRGLEVPAVGLFGTATIVVGERSGVLSVPDGAVLTDDVTGVSRVARVVRGDGGNGGNGGSEGNRGMESTGHASLTGSPSGTR